MSDYPECDKMSKVTDNSQTIGGFLEWLGEQGIRLCTLEKMDEPFEPFEDHWCPIRENIESILAKYFEIDLALVDKEKCAMLKELARRIDNGTAG